MKKLLVVLAALLFTLSVVGFASAAALTTGSVSGAGTKITETNGTGPLIGVLSAGVQLNANYNQDSYAIATAHSKGVKTYGTSAGETKVFTIPKVAGTALTASLTKSDATAFATGWTEM